LKQIAVGVNIVWALDTLGRLCVRREINPKVFPEGTYWQILPTLVHDPIHIGKGLFHYHWHYVVNIFSFFLNFKHRKLSFVLNIT
jgi:hypothetical protein